MTGDRNGGSQKFQTNRGERPEGNPCVCAPRKRTRDHKPADDNKHGEAGGVLHLARVTFVSARVTFAPNGPEIVRRNHIA